MNVFSAWSPLLCSLGPAIPCVLVLAALAWPRRAQAACALALTLVLGLDLALLAGVGPLDGAAFGIRLDVVTAVMLSLVCGIGLVIARYSQTYLLGEPRQGAYFRWLLLTLGAVTVLVITNSLLVVAAAWTATSIALHQLLTFYPQRMPALVAAHKKFLLSRLADACLWSSLTLIWLNVGSLNLDRLDAWASTAGALTPTMHLAAVLVVAAVALKSAQLPFHGWLTQVMEAPTPVSALLHAGIVNIGGFLLIRLAPWMAHAWVAQLLLVGIGLSTCVVAALVMTTRVSVKVALAWSTCAQMGFMLVQCGLGAWHLALLHLVAHSLYKAHAFLSAGSAVDVWRVNLLAPPRPRPSLRDLVRATAVALGGVAIAARLLAYWGPAGGHTDVSDQVLALLVGLALVPMFIGRVGAWALARATTQAAATALLYLGWHAMAAHLLPTAPPAGAIADFGWALVALAFLGLFALKANFALNPGGRLARALYPGLFAGLYLDERFTRLTFRLWPPRLPGTSADPILAVPTAAEA